MPKLTPEEQAAKTEARAARAAARAEAKAAADRKRKLKAEKKAARAAAVQRRAEIVTAQPHPQRDWPAERAEEEKRIKKLKKQLGRRTRKDLSKHAMFQKPVALPPPIEQPDLSDECATAAAPPPREGLIPGTYRLIDPDRYAGSLLDPDPLPPVWTGRYVGRRLVEAMDVLRRAPERVGPKSYGAAWPSYRHEAGEHAVQAGAGTLAIGRNIVIRSVGADEAARAAEALQWPLQYLSHCNAWALLALNDWAADQEADAPPASVASMLEFIANALNAAKEPVR